jgi:glycerophosphoryl diester phosphodiesterase
MIEFDVQLTKDNKMVVIHDGTVDRTTDGTGKVSELTFDEIRNLDAGSWKSPEFAGEKIPTLDETLSVMPYNIWLNVHIKGEKDIALRIAKKMKNGNRLHQAFLACGAEAAEMARKEISEILICNMDRKESNWDYVNETIEMKADFIQLRRKITPEYKEYVRVLKENGVRVNYYGTGSPEEIKLLFDYGVDFPLVNDIVHSVKVAEELNIPLVKPIFSY